MKPEISVIIPAYNEQRYIEDCLKSIRNQTFKNVEVIVVDSGNDNTSKISKRYKARIVKYIKNGPAAARNIGARIAEGRILVFSDADCRFSADFLQKIQNKFSRPIGGGICKLSVYDYEKKSDAIMYEIINSVAKLLIKMRFFVTSGSCFVYDRNMFLKAGGFREDLITNEDHDLARRVGRISRFEVFNDTIVQTSSRRLKKWGFLKTARIYTKSALFYLIADKPLREYWA